MDDSAYRIMPEFYYEEDTWSSPRKKRDPDPVMLFYCFMAVVEKQISGLLQELKIHREEGERIREMAAKLDDANRQLEELVVTDHLTGIGNRRLFVDRLAFKLAEAERGIPLTVFLVDIDNFKSFNDEHGHHAGDEALKQVASALEDVVRRVDCLARYGGEEFALASTITSEDAHIMADKLLRAVRDVRLPQREISVSIGMASYRSGDTMHSIVGRADVALYEAKRCGKDCAVLFTDIGREVDL